MPPPGIEPEHGEQFGAFPHIRGVPGNGENGPIILFGKPNGLFSPDNPHPAVIVIGDRAATTPGPGHLATYFRPHGCGAMVGRPA